VRKLVLFFAFIFSLTTFSQPFGNEWIDYSKNYYKLPIAENGVYRISFQTLLAAGVPVTTVDPNNYQLFANGKEVPLYIQGESDGVLM